MNKIIKTIAMSLVLFFGVSGLSYAGGMKIPFMKSEEAEAIAKIMGCMMDKDGELNSSSETCEKSLLKEIEEVNRKLKKIPVYKLFKKNEKISEHLIKLIEEDKQTTINMKKTYQDASSNLKEELLQSHHGHNKAIELLKKKQKLEANLEMVRQIKSKEAARKAIAERLVNPNCYHVKETILRPIKGFISLLRDNEN